MPPIPVTKPFSGYHYFKSTHTSPMSRMSRKLWQRANKTRGALHHGLSSETPCHRCSYHYEGHSWAIGCVRQVLLIQVRSLRSSATILSSRVGKSRMILHTVAMMSICWVDRNRRFAGRFKPRAISACYHSSLLTTVRCVRKGQQKRR